MKKLTIALSAALLLLGSTLVPAAHASSAKLTQVAYPDEPAFYAGQADGDAFLQQEATTYGRGSAQYNADVDAEIASAQQNVLSAEYGSDDYYYWWGYRIQLQHRR